MAEAERWRWRSRSRAACERERVRIAWKGTHRGLHCRLMCGGGPGHLLKRVGAHLVMDAITRWKIADSTTSKCLLGDTMASPRRRLEGWNRDRSPVAGT